MSRKKCNLTIRSSGCVWAQYSRTWSTSLEASRETDQSSFTLPTQKGQSRSVKGSSDRPDPRGSQPNLSWRLIPNQTATSWFWYDNTSCIFSQTLKHQYLLADNCGLRPILPPIVESGRISAISVGLDFWQVSDVAQLSTVWVVWLFPTWLLL